MKRLALFTILLAAPALAATAPAHHDANQPIAISADRFVAEKNPQSGNNGQITGTYSGNVVVTQGDIKMRANSVRINVIGGKPDKIYASGNVVVQSPSGNAQGDNGVYDVAPRLVTLTGHVVLTKGANVMRGPQLTVNLVTGVAQLGGGGRVNSTLTPGSSSGGRVQGLFTPPPQSNGH
ncbi:MAG: hypothetical protein JO348_10655 [Alphaproteobacteria bacterium]|nr:hypothetical protein [Alphaproteobacteria bacterium]MBV9420222.1 hypothetical protein [Alphaproteobacteria bacterium]MBV9541557.1 hypothetical protein [Alphaproteobacteria bacterium]